MPRASKDRLECDFYTQAQDGSLREIALMLCRVFHECARGDFGTVAALVAAGEAPPATALCRREGGLAADEDASSSDSDGEGDPEEGKGGAATGGDDMMVDAAPQAAAAARGPVVDEDGFISVPMRGRRRKSDEWRVGVLVRSQEMPLSGGPTAHLRGGD